MRILEQRFVRSAACLTLAVFVAACTVGPDYKKPELTLPDLWQTRAVEGLEQGEAPVQTWWESLDDPKLVDLLRRAETANLDLEIAVARIRESRALHRIEKGSYYPDVDAEVSAGARRFPDNAVDPLAGETVENYDIGVGVSWEIDLFGRVRRSVESATAAFEASIEDYRDVLVVLLAEVANNYVDTISLQDRIRYKTENVEAQKESLQLTRDRFSAGLTSALDVAQAESNLANTESQIPPLEARLNGAMNRIAVLLGENPGRLDDELMGRRRIPAPPEEVAMRIPADVVRQRPDIRRAERDLASQTARIGVATADLYPRLSLSGFLGLTASDAGDVLDGDAFTWNFGLPFLTHLFDGGRTRGRIEVEKARTEQLLSSYQLTVLVALEEVENAMVNYTQERIRLERLIRAVEATERSVELVRTQYLAGLTNFQNVLDSQRSLSDQQDRMAESEGFVIKNLIDLYRAMGGGWQADPENEETFTTAAFE